MTKTEMGPFVARLVELGELFEADLTESKLLLYFEALSDLDLAVALGALKAAARSCKFMPRPVELRGLALGDDEDRAEAAWLLFKRAAQCVGAYTSIATTDAALGEAIAAIFGSWPDACHAEFSPEMWSSKRKEFGRVYRVLSGRNLTGNRYLGGIVERENASRSEWQRFVNVALLDGHQVKALSGATAETYRGVLAAGGRTDLQRISPSAVALENDDQVAG